MGGTVVAIVGRPARASITTKRRGSRRWWAAPIYAVLSALAVCSVSLVTVIHERDATRSRRTHGRDVPIQRQQRHERIRPALGRARRRQRHHRQHDEYGAEGGGSHGGLGGWSEGHVSVTPGETLDIYIGGQPQGDIPIDNIQPHQNQGGFNGGGAFASAVLSVPGSVLPAGCRGFGGGGGSERASLGAGLAGRLIGAGGGGGIGGINGADGGDGSGLSGAAGDDSAGQGRTAGGDRVEQHRVGAVPADSSRARTQTMPARPAHPAPSVPVVKGATTPVVAAAATTAAGAAGTAPTPPASSTTPRAAVASGLNTTLGSGATHKGHGVVGITYNPGFVVSGVATPGISAGEFESCAVVGSGGVRCWGHDDFGQLGERDDGNVLGGTGPGDGSDRGGGGRHEQVACVCIVAGARHGEVLGP